MNRKNRKITAAIIASCLSAGSMAVPTFAEDSAVGNNTETTQQSSLDNSSLPSQSSDLSSSLEGSTSDSSLSNYKQSSASSELSGSITSDSQMKSSFNTSALKSLLNSNIGDDLSQTGSDTASGLANQKSKLSSAKDMMSNLDTSSFPTNSMKLSGTDVNTFLASAQSQIDKKGNYSFADAAKTIGMANIPKTALTTESDLQQAGVKDFSSVNAQYSTSSKGLQKLYTTAGKENRSINVDKLFNSSYGNYAKKLKSSKKATLPKGMNINSLVSKTSKAIDKQYNSNLKADGFSKVKSNFGMENIFQDAKLNNTSHEKAANTYNNITKEKKITGKAKKQKNAVKAHQKKYKKSKNIITNIKKWIMQDN